MYKHWIGFVVSGLLLGVVAGAANAEIIAYWPFEEGTGDVAADIVGGADAKLTGIDWAADQFGGFAAVSGRGSDSILVNPGPTPTTKDLSIAWWMVDSYDSWHTLMNKGTDSSQAGYYILLRPTTEDSPLRFRIGGFQAYGGWGSECRVPSGAYRDGEWVHVVCTYDSASDTATIYLNGELAPNGNYNPKTGIAGPNGYCLGTNDPSQPLYIVGQRETFGGTVDDVAIWDNALSADDVKKVFTLGPLALDPRLAGKPRPADGAIDIPRETGLAWSPGESALSHDVYLGTALEDVNDADRGSPLLVSEARNDTVYDPPGRLDFGRTYYWRIDEMTAPPDSAVVKGAVWSFTTEPVAYPVDGRTITVTASSAEANQGPENTINGSGLTDDLHSDALTAMWLTASGATGPAWIQYEFDQTLKLDHMWVWNHNGLLEFIVGLGARNVTVEYSTDGFDYTALEAIPEFARSDSKPGYAHNTTVDFGGVAAKYVRLTISSNWGGVLKQYGLSEVRFFSVPVFAREPVPVAGAANVSVDATLSWRAGRDAARHEVYLSTEEQAVIDGTAEVVTLSETQYAPAVDLDATYFWKVVEVNEDETPVSWAGPLWSFATETAAVVDDFESYNDEVDAETTIWHAWIDGLTDGKSGSQVGYDISPFAERTTVNGGKQSMPLTYDNTSATYSEAKRTFDSPQDWTQHGIKALTLRFYGNPANVPQQMYVRINNTKVPYDGAAENLKRSQWQMWYIDLTSLKVGNVSTLSIGFDRIAGAGGRGMVFIDDIKLYSYDRQLITPADPGLAGLQAQYQFEGNANDSSGNARKGSLQGEPSFAPGKTGQAIRLDGLNDYVNIDGYKGVLADATGVQHAFTVCAWIKTTTDGEIITWGKNTGGQRLSFRVDTVLRVEHGAGNVRGTNGPALRDDEWHHVAATVPDAGRMMDVVLYVDGGNVTPPSTTTAVFNLTADLDVRIGMGGPTGGRFFTGLIDDARIYDRVLLPKEIAWLSGWTVPFDKPF